MSRKTKIWLAIGAPLAAALGILLLWPAALATAAGSLINAIHVAAWMFSVVVLPLIFFTLIAFVYSVWGKTYLRAWHIRRIRNARNLREVMERGRSEE